MLLSDSPRPVPAPAESAPTSTQPVSGRVLVVDDEASARSALTELLREEGYEVQSAADGYKALGRIDSWEPDVVITDVKMPALGGIELMTKLRERLPDVAVIVMTAYGSVEGAVEAMHLGADDYLGKPVHLPQLLVVLRRVLAHRVLQKEARSLRSALAARDDGLGGVVGQAKVLRDLLDLSRQVADAPVSVLIAGEGGTGKQLLARLLHQWSGRRDGPLVILRCGALADPANGERELFGHVEGDVLRREGRVREAEGGTLVLGAGDLLVVYSDGLPDSLGDDAPRPSFQIGPTDLEEYLGPEKFQSEMGGKEAQIGVSTGLAWAFCALRGLA